MSDMTTKREALRPIAEKYASYVSGMAENWERYLTVAEETYNLTVAALAAPDWRVADSPSEDALKAALDSADDVQDCSCADDVGSCFFRLHIGAQKEICVREAVRAAYLKDDLVSRTAYAALAEENQRLAAMNAELVVGQTTLMSAAVKDGRFEAKLGNAGAELLGQALIALYRSSEGANYLEMGMQDPATLERFIVTVQRVAGKTPHELRQAAESNLAAVRATVTPLADAAHRFIEAVEGNPGPNETMDSLIALKRAIFEVRALLARASITEGT